MMRATRRGAWGDERRSGDARRRAIAARQALARAARRFHGGPLPCPIHRVARADRARARGPRHCGRRGARIPRPDAPPPPARPASPARHGKGHRATRPRARSGREDRGLRRLRCGRRDLGRAPQPLPSRPSPGRRRSTSPTACARATARTEPPCEYSRRRMSGWSSPSTAGSAPSTRSPRLPTQAST